MTKLEKKLEDLGFELLTKHFYKKKYLNYGTIEIGVCSNNDYCIKIDIDNFESNINVIIECMNEMQKDLEILKAIDKPTPKNDIGNDLWEKDVKHMQELGEWKRNQWNS